MCVEDGGCLCQDWVAHVVTYTCGLKTAVTLHLILSCAGVLGKLGITTLHLEASVGVLGKLGINFNVVLCDFRVLYKQSY